MTPNEAQEAFRIFKRIPIQLTSSPSLAERAFEIAIQHSWRYAYDAFYVALAEQQKCELWTADEVLVDDVNGDFLFVKWLGDYAPKT